MQKKKTKCQVRHWKMIWILSTKPSKASSSFDDPPTAVPVTETFPATTTSQSNDPEGSCLSNTGSTGARQRYLCLFCCLFEKKVGSSRVFPVSCKSPNEKELLLKAATALNDLEIIDKISSSDDLYYHKNAACKLKKKRTNEDKKQNTDWQQLSRPFPHLSLQKYWKSIKPCTWLI